MNPSGAVNALSHFECDLFDLLSNPPDIHRVIISNQSGKIKTLFIALLRFYISRKIIYIKLLTNLFRCIMI